MTVVNGWLLCRRDYKISGIPKQGVMDLLAFRCKITESLCNLEAYPLKRGRPSTNKVEKEHVQKKKRGSGVNIPVPDVRKDKFGYWPDVVEERQRCRYPLCKVKSSVKYEKC